MCPDRFDPSVSAARTAAVTDNGIRFVGRAARLFREVTPADELWPGRREDALFGAQVTLRRRPGPGPRAGAPGPGPVSSTVLELVGEWMRAVWPDAPRIHKGMGPVDVPAERFSGLIWAEEHGPGAWTGELLWRTHHPTVRGEAVTHHLVLEERGSFDRLTVRVTADYGLESVRAPVGAGQARPAFVAQLPDHLDVTVHGGPLAPRPLAERDVVDFVRSVLLAPARREPVAVLSPFEEGGFAMPPDEVARELLGLAPLYVIGAHRTTFRLSDAVGDKRLSCFWGALRIYMPGFSLSDDPLDHPLMVADRLLDPVVRAGELGRVGIFMGRAVALPRSILPAPAQVEAADPEGAPSADPRELQSDGADPHAGRADPDARTADPHAGRADIHADGAPPRAPREAPHSPQLDEVIALLTRSIEAQDRAAAALRRVSEEVEHLRTLTAVRSAGTAALEKRISRLDELVRERFPEEGDAEPGPGRDEAEREPRREQEGAEAAPSLSAVVRAAGGRYPNELLVLPQAESAATESPFEDVERVEAVLDAMALVARRRMNGGLGVSLRDALRELGVDYRGGISEGTSARLREQYYFTSPDGVTYDCVEHVALGSDRDPRYCLRIYFTSRAPAENRFVIGHVGRHFEVKITD
ncbi:MAG: hypothetical protein RQ751_13370 [Longimicrobiales bacterium]|nr:hypothetical protein [Longimicrobiales bacterium]